MRTLQDVGRSRFPDLDTPGTAGYSPAYAADGINDNPINPLQLVNHRASANEEQGDWTAPKTEGGSLLPPSPSVGGQPGRTNQLGWTTGLSQTRRLRQKFTGRTLVVPTMGAHPAVGPVGFSTRSQRLRNGVGELTASRLPPSSVIAESFFAPIPDASA